MPLTHAILRRYRRAKKAVVGGVLAAVPVLILVTEETSAAGGDITRNEWLTVAGAVFGIGTGVYATRNRNA